MAQFVEPGLDSDFRHINMDQRSTIQPMHVGPMVYLQDLTTQFHHYVVWIAVHQFLRRRNICWVSNLFFVGSSSPCMVNYFQVFTQDLGETPLSEAAGTLWLQNAAGKVWLIAERGILVCASWESKGAPPNATPPKK